MTEAERSAYQNDVVDGIIRLTGPLRTKGTLLTNVWWNLTDEELIALRNTLVTVSFINKG